MKELLTEWRKFVNEVGDPYSYYTPSHWRQVFSHPDTTIDTLIDRVIRIADVMSSLLYPDDPEEMEELGSAENFQREYLENMNSYSRTWFKNHEVKEEDEDKAKAIKTFVDWLNRNIDEMIKISDSGDYENVMNSKAHKILRRITDDETGNMLVALGAQLDKF
jgi:enoyl reductase-like protein